MSKVEQFFFMSNKMKTFLECLQYSEVWSAAPVPTPMFLIFVTSQKADMIQSEGKNQKLPSLGRCTAVFCSI